MPHQTARIASQGNRLVFDAGVKDPFTSDVLLTNVMSPAQQSPVVARPDLKFLRHTGIDVLARCLPDADCHAMPPGIGYAQAF
jgi:hypothetical protein